MSSSTSIPLPSAAYLANCDWIQTQIDQLVRKYPDQWIAVDQGRVLAADSDLGRVTDEARQLSSSPDVAFEFIAGITMVL